MECVEGLTPNKSELGTVKKVQVMQEPGAQGRVCSLDPRLQFDGDQN